MRAFVWVFLAAASFWMVFEQSGSTLNIFAEEVTNLNIGSWNMPASWLQSVNPFFIIIFAPIFAALWTKLADRAPRTSIKFAIALVGVGISVLLLVIPMSAYQDNGEGRPVLAAADLPAADLGGVAAVAAGLSATSKLAPEGASGQMLALWFLAVSVGTSIGGQIGKFTADDPVNTFIVSGTIPIAIAVVTIAIHKWVNRAMDPVH